LDAQVSPGERRPFDGQTVDKSVPDWPLSPRPKIGAPNVVFIVLDDMGYADLGCFGSEIATPNIDRLAENGLRYSNFHTTPICSPTRAALLTGRNHHSVGMRFLSDVDTGFPNCRGRISDCTATLAQTLLANGYSTLAVGKWHLAPAVELTPAGPFHNWPLGKGFERYYGFLGGVTDQYLPELVEDNHFLGPPTRPGYHLTEDLIDTSKRFAGDVVVSHPDRPFFLYLALGATHAPHQVPANYIPNYASIFRKGWDQTREDRLERQKALGLVPASTRLTERNPGVPAWEALDPDERAFFVQLQAAYAGFLEHTDEHLGRLFAFLQQIGKFDDTIIVLLSDNGAADQGGRDGAFNVLNAYNGVPEALSDNLSRLVEIGSPTSASMYPAGWAMAGNTPFRRYKHFVDGGGVNTPLIVHWPGGIKDRGAIRTSFVHAVDIAPTILDLAGLSAQPSHQGVPQKPMEGSSIAPSFDEAVRELRRTQYFEMFGQRGIWHAGWKAVADHEPGADYAKDKWRLYRVTEDFSECIDLAQQELQKLEALIKLWWEEAARCGVLPLDDRGLWELLFALPHGVPQAADLIFYPGQSYLPVSAAPRIGDRSFRIYAEIDRKSDADQGVIICVGTASSGYTFYVKDNTCSFEYNSLGKRSVFTSDDPIPLGPATLEFRLHRTGCNKGQGTLLIDGVEVASGEIPRLLHHLSFIGLQVGRNRYSPVSPQYADSGEFVFTKGALLRVVFSVGEDGGPDPNRAEVATAQQ
jgi:arylsulfatase